MPAANDVEVVGDKSKKSTRSNFYWYGTASRFNASMSFGSAGIQYSSSTFRLTNGLYNGNQFSPKIYKSGWIGGSRANIKTYSFLKLGRSVGKFTLIAGFAIDGVGVYNYYYNSNSVNIVSPKKGALNTGMAIVGIWSAPASITYFAIDNFHPGGWRGWAESMDNLSKYADERVMYGPKM